MQSNEHRRDHTPTQLLCCDHPLSSAIQRPPRVRTNSERRNKLARSRIYGRQRTPCSHDDTARCLSKLRQPAGVKEAPESQVDRDSGLIPDQTEQREKSCPGACTSSTCRSPPPDSWAPRRSPRPHRRRQPRSPRESRSPHCRDRQPDTGGLRAPRRAFPGQGDGRARGL